MRNEEVHLNRFALEGGGHPKGAFVDPADARPDQEQLHAPLNLLALGSALVGVVDQTQVSGRQRNFAARAALGEASAGQEDLPLE